uniref:Zn(2)-C6 fungal-type domain-containing protein n=1 Tax=Kwoniella bestiolae CBS 10118 TaxID=1296100 RepID=A0A1B9FX23_9TREE|nr:hypothetical protein I302_07680 [Kwoniella bestiolae CBS 10118]OCF23326.1 hypothetical protein I302_07680 [Kwoniella bestiolae CBS 10118]
MEFGAGPSSSAYPSFDLHSQTLASSSTSSFPPPPSPSPSSSETPRTGKNQRKKSGCLTCRLRKKKCDEGKPACGACIRLGLDCMGYDAKRPGWMNKKDKVKDATAQIKQTVNETRSAKMRSHWAERAASVSGRGDDGRSVYSPEDQVEMLVDKPIVPAKTATYQQVVTTSVPTNTPVPMPGGSYPTSYGYDSGHTRGLYTSQYNPTATSSTHAQAVDPLPAPFSSQSTVSSPLIDPDILNLLGLVPPTKPSDDNAYFPLYPQLPNTLWFPYPSALESRENLEDMRYFHHYLTVILPLQFRFDNQPISDLVAPLALQNPRVLQAFSAIAALHIAHKKRRQPILMDGNIGADHASSHNIPNSDDVFARTTIQAIIRELKSVPTSELGSDDSILAALSANSFNLFDGGETKSWVETAELCRRCLTAVLTGVGGIGSNVNTSRHQIDISPLMDRLGHLISPLMWVDILMSLTQNKASLHLPVYRVFMLDQYRTQGNVSKLLRETVMGCDNTTRLALAETVALSEWKEKAIRSGTLSHRALVERADSIERLLMERKWREEHLFQPDDPSTVQRMAMSNVFHHGVRVLLATVLDGCYPNVPDIATAVQDTADALLALDKCDAQGATDKLMIFPIVIAGCHAERPALQRVFRNRFVRLGDDGTSFGNTRSALRLMEEVWKRRAEGISEQAEIHWRTVMFELYEGGLLLI